MYLNEIINIYDWHISKLLSKRSYRKITQINLFLHNIQYTYVYYIFDLILLLHMYVVPTHE